VTISVDQIATTYAQRRLAAGPGQAAMREVQRLVDGDLAVPLPELDKNERDMIPNRAAKGIEQLSQRIAIVAARCLLPAVAARHQGLSESRARDRRRANLGWWGANEMGLLLRQRARYLQGYARTPVQIRWDLTRDPAVGRAQPAGVLSGDACAARRICVPTIASSRLSSRCGG
jgi:hypothetical protein